MVLGILFGSWRSGFGRNAAEVGREFGKAGCLMWKLPVDLVEFGTDQRIEQVNKKLLLINHKII